ncbi:MAG: hypothetical protein AAB371_00250 [Patescibacteria group bacterium]
MSNYVISNPKVVICVDRALEEMRKGLSLHGEPYRTVDEALSPASDFLSVAKMIMNEQNEHDSVTRESINRLKCYIERLTEALQSIQLPQR